MTLLGDIQPRPAAGLEMLARLATLPLPEGPPRVFFDRAGLDRLRDQARGPDWEAVRGEARALATEPATPLMREAEPDGGLLRLAFAFAIWREPAVREAALALVQALLQAPTWVAPSHRQVEIDLRSCTVSSSLALTWDLLGEDLPPPVGKTILQRLLERDLGRFPEVLAAQTDWWTHRRMNWQSVINSHLGIATMALAGSVPDWRARLGLALRVLLDFLDDCPRDGSFLEGLTYWHYGIGELAWFALALQTFSQGKLDLFQHPYLQATQQFPLHMSAPDGSFDFEDSANFAPRGWLVALLARQHRNRYLQALVTPYHQEPVPHRKIDAPARGMRFLVSRDPGLAPASLDEQPRCRYFPGNDTVTMRSDWGPQSTFLALHGGSNHVPHGHLDAGSFILGHAGRRLVPDGGFWPYTRGFFERTARRWDFDGPSTLGHSLVLVDGQGQGWQPGCRGRIEAVELAGAVPWAVCDVTAAYEGRLQRFVRYLLFVQPRTVVLVDDIVAEGPRRLKWLLQYRESAQLRPPVVELRHGDALATVAFPLLAPGSSYRFSREERTSFYEATAPDAEPPPPVRLVSVSPGEPVARWQVVAVFGLSERQAVPPRIGPAELTEQALRLQLEVEPGRQIAIGLDFDARAVAVARDG
jgi:hypothetical protein